MTIAVPDTAVLPQRTAATVSVRSQILMLAASVAFVSAAVVGVIDYIRIVEITRSEALAKLEGQERLIAPHVQAGYDALRADVLTISHTPPFAGLARTIPNGGRDPKDGSTTLQWRQRLETIFSSIMSQRPDYIQMRLVGIADQGLEIVRVDRRDDDIVPIRGDDLQQKAGEPYFQDGLELPVGTVGFSAITLNHDYGQVQGDLPVIRVITPIAGPNGKTFGFVVINAHAGLMLRSILEDIHSDGDAFILTDTGDYMSRTRDGEISAFNYRGALDPAAPPFVRLLQSSAAESETVFSAFDGVRYAIHISRYDFRYGGGKRFLKTALVVPEDDFIAGVQKTRQTSIFIGCLLVVFASLASLIVARMITQPLEDMVDGARAYGNGRKSLDLPTSRSDEIGELSRAFSDLVSELEWSRGAESSTVARMKTMRTELVDALIAIDGNGSILEFNKSAEVMFGYATDDAVGRNISLLMPETATEHGPDETMVHKYLNLGALGVIGNLRVVKAVRSDGTTFPAELRVSEFNVGEGQFFDAIVRDISARIAMEEKLADYTSALELSNQDLDDFAYIASHDLKEPLRGIANHVRFLREDYGSLIGEDGQRRIERLQELCLRIDRLTSELLQWSRLSRVALDLEAIDLNDVVEDVRVSLAEIVEEKQASIVVAGTLPSVTGDRSRILSVFMNLVVNAIKYNDSEEKRIEIGVLPDGAGRQGVSGDVLYVKDNGIGIAPDFHDTVFVVFKRLNAEKTYGPGTGAGLSFVKKIIKRHGGKIWLESEPGVGTTFFFTLPGASHDAS